MVAIYAADTSAKPSAGISQPCAHIQPPTPGIRLEQACDDGHRGVPSPTVTGSRLCVLFSMVMVCGCPGSAPRQTH